MNDVSNEPAYLRMVHAEGPADALAQAQLDRNDAIYQRQHEMKALLNNLVHLKDIRALEVA
ncbi:hypothetical protein [Escherichia coli]|uniref:hypothetical protein n=1 Tax=Escherichia coli TaxID=562 RepID=UPI00396560D2